MAVLGVTNGRNARIVLVLRFDEKRTWERRRWGVVKGRGGGGSIVNEQKEVGLLKESGTLVLLIYGGRGREVGRMRVVGRKG